MFGRAAEKFLHAAVLHPAHHDHIHVMFVDEFTQRRHGLSHHEVPAVGGDAVLLRQFEEGAFIGLLQIIVKGGQRDRVQPSLVERRGVIRMQYVKFGLALQREAGGWRHDG